MTRDEARAQFSDYLEGALEPRARDEMQAFLAREPEAASEMIALERTLSLLHRLPPREPSLDLWREFAPHAEAFKAARRLTPAARLRAQWHVLVMAASEGVILWTQAVAAGAHLRLGRHLRHDAWHPSRADRGGERRP